MGENQFKILLAGMIDEAKTTSNINKQILMIQDKLKKLNISINLGDFDKKITEALKNVEKSASNVKKVVDDVNKSTSKNSLTNNAKQMNDYYNSARQYMLEFKKGTMDSVSAFKELEKMMFDSSSKNGYSDKFNALNITQQKSILSDHASLQKEINSTSQETLKINQEISKEQDKQNANVIKQDAVISQMSNKLVNIQSKYGGFVDKGEVTRIQSMITELQKADTTTNTYRARLAQVNSEITTLGRNSSTAFKQSQDKLSDTVSKTTSWGLALRTVGQFFAIGSPIFVARKVFTEITSSINEMNKSMTDIRIITGISTDSVYELRDSYNDLAKSMGATTNELMKGSVEWYRQGKTISEVNELIQASMVGSKLSGVDSESMSQYLTSSIQGFKLDASDAISVVDKLIAVDNAAATSVEELAIAMSHTASSAQMAGVDMDTLIGYIGTVSAVTRKSAESIGNSFKTIFARYQDIKITGPGGFLDDGVGVSDIEKTFDAIGVKIKESETEFRDFGKVIDDLSGKWVHLSTVEKSAIAKSLAGVRQRENFIVLMDSMNQANELTEKSLESSGLAMDRFGKYLESTEAKINTFKATAESVFAKTLSSETTNKILDVGIAVLSLVDSMGGLVPVLTSVLGLVAMFKFQAIGSAIFGMITGVGKLGASIAGLSTSFSRASASIGLYNKGAIGAKALTMSLTPVMGALTIAIGALMMANSAYQQKQEENSRKLQERIDKTKEEVKSIEDLTKTYETLSSSSKTDKKTRDELLQVQKDITSQLGLEKDALDLLNGSYKDNIDIINRATEEKLKTLEIDAKVKYEESIAELENAMKSISKDGMMDLFGEFSYVDTESLESARKVAKEMSDEFGSIFRQNFSTSGFSFNINTDDYNKAYEALSKLKVLMADNGLAGTKAYAGIASELDKLKGAMDNLSSSQETFETAQTKLDIQNAKTKLGIDNLTKATKEQYLQMRQELSKGFMNGLSMTSEQAENMTKKLEVLDGMFPEFASSIGIATEEVNDLSVDMEKLDEQFDDFVDNIDLIDSAMKKLAEGSGLTTEEILKLVEAFPQLKDNLIKTKDGYTINEEALKGLRGETVEYEKQAMKTQIANTKIALQQCQERLSIYIVEASAIKDLASAQDALNNAKDTASASQYGNYRPVGYDKKFSEEEKQVLSYVETMEELYERLELINVVDVGGTDKGDKKEKSSKSILDGLIKNIQSKRKILDEEIDMIQAKLDAEIVLGNQDGITKYSNEMAKLIGQRKSLTEEENKAYRSLLTRFTKEEEQNKLNELIAENSKEWWNDRKRSLEEEIELINNKYNIEKQAYDDKLRSLEMQQILMDENSSEYQAIEQQKLDLLVMMQEKYQDKIRLLKEQGLTNEADDVRTYIDLWTDAQEEIANLTKSRLEKQRELEIKQLNDMKDKVEERLNAEQKILDLTIEMIKAEEKAKLDSDKKVINEEINNAKKVADYRKKLLQKEKDERAYNKDVNKANKEISDIQRELDKIQFDNSEWAIAERLKLEEQLKEKTDALDDKQYEKKIDDQMQAIDDQLKLFEEQKKKELEIVEESAMTEAEIRAKAIDMVDKKNSELYKKLQKYVKDTGKVTQYEFETAWDIANKGVEEFGINSKNTLEVLYELQKVMENIAKQAKVLGDAPLDYGSVGNGSNNSGGSSSTNKPSTNNPSSGLSEKGKQQLEYQKELHKLAVEAKTTNNKELLAFIESERRKWGLDPKTGAIIKQFHTGLSLGRVSDGLQPNELITKLTKDEWVFTGKQFDNLTSNIKGLVANNQKPQMPPINLVFNGTVTDGAKPMLNEFKVDIEKLFYKLLNKNM